MSYYCSGKQTDSIHTRFRVFFAILSLCSQGLDDPGESAPPTLDATERADYMLGAPMGKGSTGGVMKGTKTRCKRL